MRNSEDLLPEDLQYVKSLQSNLSQPQSTGSDDLAPEDLEFLKSNGLIPSQQPNIQQQQQQNASVGNFQKSLMTNPSAIYAPLAASALKGGQNIYNDVRGLLGKSKSTTDINKLLGVPTTAGWEEGTGIGAKGLEALLLKKAFGSVLSGASLAQDATDSTNETQSNIPSPPTAPEAPIEPEISENDILSPEQIEAAQNITNAAGAQAGNDLATSKMQLQKISDFVNQTAPSVYKNELMGATEGIGSMPEFVNANAEAYEEAAEIAYGMRKTHSNFIPSMFNGPSSTGEIDITKPFTLSNGMTLQPYDLKMLKNSKPNIFNELTQTNNPPKNSYQINNLLNERQQSLLKKYVPEEFDAFSENPSIENQFQLQKSGNKRARTIGDSNIDDRNDMFQTTKNIRENGIIPGLQEADQKFGTNTAAPFAAGDKIWSQHVAPFDATPRLSQVSWGTDKNISEDELLSEIDKGKRLQNKFNKKLSRIPDGHFLDTLRPQLSRLSQFKANQEVKNLTEGRGNQSAKKISENLSELIRNGKMASDHPLVSMFKRPLDDAIANHKFNEEALESVIKRRKFLEDTKTKQNEEELKRTKTYEKSVERHKKDMTKYLEKELPQYKKQVEAAIRQKEFIESNKKTTKNITKKIVKNILKHKVLGYFGLGYLFRDLF